MLRISRLTDYAFILLDQLAEEEDNVVSCSTLTEHVPLPMPTVRKVCKQLAQDGLLVSHQGAHGGYELTDTLDKITAARVIEAMEGPIAITVCSDQGDECELEAACPTSRSWKAINQAIRTALDGLTLAEMQHGVEASAILQPSTPEAAEPSPTRNERRSTSP